jgi:hypothetical protein
MVRRLAAGGRRIRSYGALSLSKNPRDSAILGEAAKWFCPRFCPRRNAQKTRLMRSFAGRTSTTPRKAFHSYRHAASSYLRNNLLSDGSPVAKERCGKVPARPRGKERSRRVWRAMDQAALSRRTGIPVLRKQARQRRSSAEASRSPVMGRTSQTVNVDTNSN